MYNPADIVELIGYGGSSAKVHVFGATLVSWVCKGEERIFVSSQSLFDGKKAIRGGIPLVFPCFGPWEHGPQHGFARICRWAVDKREKNANGEVIAVFSLKDNEESRKMWNHKFHLKYTVTLTENSLSTSFNVINTDKAPFDFTCLLHTYLKVPDVSYITVGGLQGLNYVDKVEGKSLTEGRKLVTIANNVDRVYENTPSRHEIRRTMKGDTLTIEKLNLPDTVLWNPWAEKAAAMSDFGSLEYPIMVCVEAGHVSSPIKLEAGKEYCGSQTLHVA